jgi:hypothetical protein
MPSACSGRTPSRRIVAAVGGTPSPGGGAAQGSRRSGGEGSGHGRCLGFEGREEAAFIGVGPRRACRGRLRRPSHGREAKLLMGLGGLRLGRGGVRVRAGRAHGLGPGRKG